MIKTLFDKGTWIGRTTLLPGVIRRQMCKGHPGPAPTAARGMPIGRDHRRSPRIPNLRRLILLSVISVLASLAVTAPASAASFFSNPTPIAIPGSGDIGNASPYPSEIAVSGLTGPITSVAVTLHRFGHGVPSNADILLVSPSGDTVIVMSDACSPATEIEDFTWTFSQQAAGPMTAPCGESVYQPTNNAGADNFPGAPAGPRGTSFNDFNNENPNGTWKLYVVDDFDEGITGVDDIGDIEVGWTLAIETGPVDVAIPASGTSGPASPYPATRTLTDLKIEKTSDGRKLLRFSSIIVNVGDGPLQVHGQRPDTGASTMTTVQRIFDEAGEPHDAPTDAVMHFGGDGHNHWHVRDLESFELERLRNGSKVGTGAKHGFCFWDNHRYGSEQDPYYAGCGQPTDLEVTMGLSVGWGDLYRYSLPDQYIDITGLGRGRYRLIGTADADNWFRESEESNNSTWVDIRIRNGRAKVVGYGPT